MRRLHSRASCTAARRLSALENVATSSVLRGIGDLLSVVVIPVRSHHVRAMPDYAFYLPYGDHREEPDKQQETCEEEPKTAYENTDVNDRRSEIAPARRQVSPVLSDNDDDEAFEPHTDVNQDRNHKNCGWTCTDFL